MAVSTFEWLPQGLGERRDDPNLSAASVALPEGVYTTFRTYGGRKVLRLGQHAKRLVESAALKGTPGDLGLDRLRAAVTAALDATRHPDSRFRVTFAPPRLFVSIEPFTPLPGRLYEEGVACVTVALRRDNPHAKDTRFIATASAAYAELPAGIEEGLMVADDGVVLEGLSSNFFAVRDGRVWTEEQRILAGVTRALVLEVAEGFLPVERTAIPVNPAVRECFITSVSREVLPVVRVDDRDVADGRPGPVTCEIARRFAQLVDREAKVV